MPYWPYLLLTVLVILVYLPTFSGDFLLDDRPLIQNNPYIRTFHSPISYLAQEDGNTDEFDRSPEHTGYYRPLINLTYSIDYKLWGLTAPGFRTTNLIFHLISCIILFHFLQFLVKDRYAAWGATLIFAMHPAHTETISWIASRNNILVTLFSIASLFFYARSRERRSNLMWAASILMFVLAILSKEMGLMVFPLLFLSQRFLSHKTKNYHEEVLSYLPFVIMIIAYFLIRREVIGAFTTPVQIDGLWERICFAPYLILLNLKLIFLPYGLHSFLIGYPSSCLSWQAIAGFCYIGFAGIIIWGVRKNRLLIFSVLSFHVALFPTLNIIPFSAVTLVSMRWLYFSMAFLMIGVAQGLRDFFKANSVIKRVIMCAVLAYLGAYSFILNNSLWKNEASFFRQEVVNFGNAYYAAGLAENLLGQKNYKDAEGFFQLAIQKYPLDAKNYLNYSALLIDTGRPEAAVAYLEEAEDFDMSRYRRGQWQNNMGVAHFQLKKYGEALRYFKNAVTYYPDNADYHTNLGGAYAAVGNYVKAVSVLERGLETAPDSVALRKNLALIHIRMNRYKDAISVLEGIPRKEWKKHDIEKLYEEAETGIRKREGYR
ncbi:MAG: tetratricopeptide repeat protein [Deltaproteobacteria bacterium]|nr:tetratricopeptide repeat protein [Deltaproteobacteria bacterium]